MMEFCLQMSVSAPGEKCESRLGDNAKINYMYKFPHKMLLKGEYKNKRKTFKLIFLVKLNFFKIYASIVIGNLNFFSSKARLNGLLNGKRRNRVD